MNHEQTCAPLLVQSIGSVAVMDAPTGCVSFLPNGCRLFLAKGLRLFLANSVSL